ncbi:MAG: hypothetical protein APR53_00885, partial [Methanoculleus sp. SDB]
MQGGARAEWETLREVLVHEPGIEVFFALLSPSAHLYERFFDLEGARREHRQLRSVLHDLFGIRVRVLCDTIRDGARQSAEIREILLSLARKRFSARCDGDACTLSPRIRQAWQEAAQLDDRDPAHLSLIACLNPALVFGEAGIRTELAHPLHNLYFMRDQQVACARGIIQARMAHRDREAEVEFAGLGLVASGYAPSGRISSGRLEGGDFIPLGDAALIGVGPRTDREGAAALLAQDPGFDEIAVVHQRGHPLVAGHDPMVAMHLDTYMNIASQDVVVGNPLLLSAATVTLYDRDGGQYRPKTETMPLDAYLRDRGWSIIPITTLEQLCYASNFLCVRDGACVTPDTEALAPGVLLRVREKARAFPEKYGPLLRQAEHDLQVLRADAEFFPH